MPFFERLRSISRSHRVGAGSILFGVLATYYGLAIVSSPTGPAIAAHSWTVATRGLVGLKTPTVEEMEPVDQARFWLGKIKSLDSQDPEVLCGAAWILSEPNPRHIHRKLKRPSFPFDQTSAGLVPPVIFDEEAIRRAEKEFETLCQGTRLDLVVRATSLQPENQEVWRARARLLSRSGIFAGNESSRSDHWFAALSEGARHDPENSLYDLMVAVQRFRQGARLDFAQEHVELQIHDDAKFQDGLRHLEAVLARTHLQFGCDRFLWCWKFVSQADDVRADPVKALAGLTMSVQEPFLLREITQWQAARAHLVAEQKDLKQAAKILSETRKIVDQCAVREGNDVILATIRPVVLRSVLGTQVFFGERYPGIFTPAELEAIRREQQSVMDVEKLLLKRTDLPAQTPEGLEKGVGTSLGVLASHVPASLAPLLVLCGAAWGIGKAFGRRASPNPVASIAWWQIALLWGVALASTVATAFALTFFSRSGVTAGHLGVLRDVPMERLRRVAVALVTWANFPLEWLLPVEVLAGLALWRWGSSRLSRRQQELAEPRPTLRHRIVGFARDGARCLWPVAALGLAFHLLFLPTLIRMIEARDRDYPLQLEPQTRWNEVDQRLKSP
jgi:hypothetical protein